MNDEAIKRDSSAALKDVRANKKSGTDPDRLAPRSETSIGRAAQHDADFDSQDDDWLARAELEMPKPKQLISLRLDTEILDWFRSHGPGYQTRVNAVLLSYVKKHKRRDE